MHRKFLISVLAVLVLGLCKNASGEDLDGSSDHPMLTRFPGAEIADYDQRRHDMGWLPGVTENGEWVAGLLTWIVYNGPTGHSTLEIYKNYEKALLDGDFKVHYACKKKDCGRDFIENLLEATSRMVGNGERWVPGTERHLTATKVGDNGRHTWVNLTVYERNNEGAVRIRLEIIEENEPRVLAALPSERLAGNSVNYDEVSLATGKTVKNKLSSFVELEGKIDWSVVKYTSPSSAYELFASTQKALREQGYVIDFQCHLRGCGKYFDRELIKLNNHPLPKGERWSRNSVHYLLARKPSPEGLSYVSAAAYMHPEGYAKLRRVDVATTELDFNLVSVTGESMADELEASGKVAVYGVYFDTDSADLKAESNETLGEIAAMLGSNPDIELYVDGHSDGEGEDAYNKELSARRAQSVVAWLIDKGIAAERLEARGFGEEQPVAENSTEEGRAWNRRVELVAR